MNIQNLQKLYEVGQKILRERLGLGFGAWDCGSYCCLGGWYDRFTGLNTGVLSVQESARHFGISQNENQQLFGITLGAPDMPGPAAYAELSRRMEYLAGLIREAGGEVPKPHSTKHEGLPPSVRAIFAERVA